MSTKESGTDKTWEIINYSYLAIGSNIGKRKRNLNKSISYIKSNVGKIYKSSKIYESEPWGFKKQNYFLNQIILVETKLTPLELLNKCKEIEKKMGRKINIKWRERNIDIDILYYNSDIIDEKLLKIPHPHIEKRKFVLIPLNELDEDYIHPKLMKSNSYLLETCEDKCIVKEYGKL